MDAKTRFKNHVPTKSLLDLLHWAIKEKSKELELTAENLRDLLYEFENTIGSRLYQSGSYESGYIQYKNLLKDFRFDSLEINVSDIESLLFECNDVAESVESEVYDILLVDGGYDRFNQKVAEMKRLKETEGLQDNPVVKEKKRKKKMQAEVAEQ